MMGLGSIDSCWLLEGEEDVWTCSGSKAGVRWERLNDIR